MVGVEHELPCQRVDLRGELLQRGVDCGELRTAPHRRLQITGCQRGLDLCGDRPLRTGDDRFKVGEPPFIRVGVSPGGYLRPFDSTFW
jgi:hypothetical protein